MNNFLEKLAMFIIKTLVRWGLFFFNVMAFSTIWNWVTVPYHLFKMTPRQSFVIWIIWTSFECFTDIGLWTEIACDRSENNKNSESLKYPFIRSLVMLWVVCVAWVYKTYFM